MNEEPQRRPAPRYVTTIEELQTLDSDQVVKGYLAGYKNLADFSERDRAYWHGYLNGQVDGGFCKSAPEQAELARVVVASGYLRKMFATPVEA